MALEFIREGVTWVVDQVGKWGYGGIVIMMSLESSFVPFPSEVVMPPAGYHAHEANGATMSLPLVIACGVLGSVLGALLNYYLAVWLGRPALLRVAHWPIVRWLISEKKLLRMEAYFKKHGEITTFVGRLIPGVRQYISFPAGLARMPIIRFVVITALGAGIWVAILSLIGYGLGAMRATMTDEQFETMVAEQSGTALAILIPILVVGTILYIIWHRWFDKKLDRLVEAEGGNTTGERGADTAVSSQQPADSTGTTPDSDATSNEA